jgi:hypothetical protein
VSNFIFSSGPHSSNPRWFPEPVQGITDRAIAYGLPGRVKYNATYWHAKLFQPDRQVMISPGEPVSIVAIQGITLLVVPTGLFDISNQDPNVW